MCVWHLKQFTLP
uniref:Uncharacterized protein n=1 Tax=Anguilla anguilla TaxID=7936 RepID=A0A0E9V062_ANGAN